MNNLWYNLTGLASQLKFVSITSNGKKKIKKRRFKCMLVELEEKEFKQVEHFFSEHIQYIPARAVLRGDFPGRVFVDQCMQPQVVIVWVLGRWCYLEGKQVGVEQLKGIIAGLWQEMSRENLQLQWLEIYTKEEGQWEKEFFAPDFPFSVSKHYESTYTLNEQTFSSLPPLPPLLPPFSCEQQDFPILPIEYSQNPGVKEEWRRKSRPGVVLKKGDRTIALCKNNGFELENSFFIDVDTFDEQERGKGFATRVSRALIEYSLAQGHTPLWETTHQNLLSHKLALKLGFERVCTYPVYFFKLMEKHGGDFTSSP